MLWFDFIQEELGQPVLVQREIRVGHFNKGKNVGVHTYYIVSEAGEVAEYSNLYFNCDGSFDKTLPINEKEVAAQPFRDPNNPDDLWFVPTHKIETPEVNVP